MKNLICLKIQFGNKFNIEKIKLIGQTLDNDDVLVFFIGNIFDKNQKKISVQKIYSLYKEHKINIVNYLDGTYSIIIIDKKEKKLYVFQDFLGSNHSIYFYKCKEFILISNELKQIILEAD